LKKAGLRGQNNVLERYGVSRLEWKWHWALRILDWGLTAQDLFALTFLPFFLHFPPFTNKSFYSLSSYCVRFTSLPSSPPAIAFL
jgi:hypothetical protein